MAFVRVTEVKTLVEGEIYPFELRRTKFVLCRPVDGDQVYALANECSHDCEPISSGRTRGHELVCTRHGARFDMRTGEVTHPPAIVPIATFGVKIEEGVVYVDLP